MPKVVLSGTAVRRFTGGQTELQVKATTFRRLVLELGSPVDAAAPGQTACLMWNESVVGWGTISEPEEPPAGAGTLMEAANAA